ncbi:multidrug effflux MFS transporter [Bradyrhizobium genosp. P]|uniref:multidrug effflux MFS transporter n=1 Tax=Bradyrhizobium genosp. P TaxID=83641 RepID=UPI003CEF932B
MRIAPNSVAFSWLLGLLSALPTFGIDMILPTLPATAAALGAQASEVGLAMSVYLLGLGAALVVYGPVSDRIGRRPIIMFGAALLTLASVGCMLARSLPVLLIFRTLQGVGASGPGMGALTIVRDLFEGEEARARMSYVVFAINIVPMVAPSVGAALLTFGGWQAVYWVPLAGGCILLVAMRGLAETARIDPDARFSPITVVRDYLSVLSHPICLGNAICNAAAAGTVFAYITGSSLFLINVIGLGPSQYGVVFGASSLSVMAGSLLNRRLNGWGVTPRQMIAIGLSLSTVLAACLMVMALADGRSIMVVVLVMTGVALSFGLISPNAMSEALEPVPAIAGAAGAVVMFMQMLGAASSSWLVSWLFDGRSALSMAVTMLAFCLLAIAAELGVIVVAGRQRELSTKAS